MLRRDAALLGRWGHRDFMRGRTKCGGAIHTRHTHGSRGRYKRLSTLFGPRDGRRHAWNHMKGGLGVKLGGGLFGLRIPRQHALANMTPEEYELNVYGHPNITNPYRDVMDEHPDLKSVMSNACLDVHIVVLMPRVPRALRYPTSTNGSSDAGRVVPQSWTALLRNVCEAVRGDGAAALGCGNHITLHCGTLSASVTCQQLTSDALLSDAIAALHADHQRGIKINSTPQVSSNVRRRIPLLGLGLIAPQSLRGAAAAEGPTGALHTDDKRNTVSPSGAVSQCGVAELVRHLQQQHPNALRVCLRLSGSEPNGSPEPESAPRKLLKEELDPDATGVWSKPESTMAALMRWQYNNWDPRAHVSDGVPHSQRFQPVHIFLDASRLQEEATGKEPTGRKAAARSLMSLHFSEKLLAMNYQPVSHRSLAEVFEALGRWSMDYHWRTFGLKRQKLEKHPRSKNAITERKA